MSELTLILEVGYDGYEPSYGLYQILNRMVIVIDKLGLECNHLPNFINVIPDFSFVIGIQSDKRTLAMPRNSFI